MDEHGRDGRLHGVHHDSTALVLIRLRGLDSHSSEPESMGLKSVRVG